MTRALGANIPRCYRIDSILNIQSLPQLPRVGWITKFIELENRNSLYPRGLHGVIEKILEMSKGELIFETYGPVENVVDYNTPVFNDRVGGTTVSVPAESHRPFGRVLREAILRMIVCSDSDCKHLQYNISLEKVNPWRCTGDT